MDLSSRRKTGKTVLMDTSISHSTSGKKSGVRATSEMQGILAIKEKNELTAADIVADFLASKAESTYDEKLLTNNLNNLLNGFTTEEKFRIVSTALVRALCKIS